MCPVHIARCSLTFKCLKFSSLNLLVVNHFSVSQITHFSYIFKFAIIALNYIYYVFDVTTHTLVYLKYFSTQEIKVSASIKCLHRPQLGC